MITYKKEACTGTLPLVDVFLVRWNSGEMRKIRDLKVGIIGFGNMGSALVSGLLTEKIVSPHNILVSDVRPQAQAGAKRQFRVRTSGNIRLARESNIIILAVKPQIIPKALEEIRDVLTPRKILISIAAGVTTRKIESFFPGVPVPVIRVMPNLPVKVRKGIIAYAFGRYGKGKGRLVEKLFSPVGKVIPVPEDKMDAITALSGSGPGYLFYWAEILEKICRKKGFSGETARLIPGYLLAGAGEMLLASRQAPADLKKAVSSPGGTTLAGLRVLEKRKLPQIWKSAVSAAEKRSKELAR